MKKWMILFMAVCAFAACKKEIILESIAVTTQPNKKEYFVNEAFDPAGMVVTATYSDKSTKPVTVTENMLEYDFSAVGTNKTVTITFAEKGKTATTTVNGITVNEATLESIAVITQPTKKIYVIGEEFDPAGMVVTAIYSDKSTKPVTVTKDMLEYDFSEADENKTVTITYEGKVAVVNRIIVVLFLGNGISAATAYQIGNPIQLAKLAELVNEGINDYIRQYYKLTADIDLSDYGEGWNNGKGWVPIGRGFFGYFDGNNHKVTGLYINDDELDFAGLFGATFYGTVQNLSVDGKVTGRNFVGGLTGSVAYNCKIINCYVTGTVNGNERVGGLAGSAEGSGGSVTNCYTSNAVSGNERVGGLVGYVEVDNINNCYTTGIVSGKYYIGGVVGYISSSMVFNCYATGAVSGNERVGGVAGYVAGSVLNCYATGEISGNKKIGGLVGEISNGSNTTNCYATGAVSGTGDYVGGIAGMSNVETFGFVSIHNCAALNPSVTLISGFSIGRVAGIGGTLNSNVALNGMTVNGSTVTSSNGSNLDGADIDKVNTKTQLAYNTTMLHGAFPYEFKLDWQFGNEDYNPWKMGVGNYSLPVFWWQTSAPTAMPEHLR